MTVNGVMLSMVLIIFAIGLSLAFGIMRIVNFAHGEIYMLGGMFMWFFYAKNDWFIVSNYAASLVLTMALVGAIGFLMERLFFRKIRGNLLPGMIISVGLIFVMQASMGRAWGFTQKGIPTPSWFEGGISALGANIPNERLWVIAICIVAVVLLYLFLQHTRYGRRMRASAENPDAATLLGIDIGHTGGIAMAVGAALAALGGALAGTLFQVDSAMGALPLMKAFVAIILGGMGSLPGTVLGGFIVGFTESFGTGYLSNSAASMLIFGVLIFVLVVRPTGFLGRAVRH
ncbi:branched-chain amino acid ABC transporter permease [Chloroflexota bacterium]